jgi:predicted ATPase/class 3 adenylate cyclase
MVCQGCGTEVAASAKFCPECGQVQQAACAGCGSPLAASAKFCPECGSPTGVGPSRTGSSTVPTQASSAPIAERRVCSVLFCDLVGFTPMSETRDPEEVRELLSKYFEVARTIIGRFGGVVEKFIGDAVMAVWGAPVAVDGDAERAVRAALDVVEAVTELGREAGIPGLAARAGVVTGEVAVTVGATGQGMVAGDAVNTAARVQSAAADASVLVDEGTWRLARGAVAFTDAGENELKGKSEPVRLWRADRVMSGVGGAQRVDGLEAPLVGRDAELRLIKELFHACVDRRSPRLVSITGPAGVGKSRLGWEFFKYIDGVVELVRWHRGRCLSYGDGVAFWALAEMVRQRFGIAEDDSSQSMAEKLATGLDEWVHDAATRDYVAPRLARLLGVGSEGAGLGRDELFAGWRVFFESMAATEPVVLLVEDLHHADDGLLDFIEHLLDWARDVPILVMTLARPELADRRPGWGLGRRNSTALTLEPLDDTAMRAMLEGLVPGMPDSSAAAIASQAQGVPLYAVETVRMLVDRDVVQPVDGVYRLVGDVGELLVPDTLQSLLAARLDALEPTARRLIADAAVLGGSFPLEALVAVSGLSEAEVTGQVKELVRREVLAVRADPLSPERGQYAFVQTMFRQVAYDTLSRRERKTRHLAVAEHLARAFGDGGEEISEVIAQHLLDALEAVPDDTDVPQLRDRAVNALIRAGERAERTAAMATATRAFSRAAALEEQSGSAQTDHSAAGLYERAAVVAGTANDQPASEQYWGRAAALYDRHGDERQAARARTGVGGALRRQGRLEEAEQVLRGALAVLQAETTADSVAALEDLAVVVMLAGRADAQDLAHEALVRAQELRLDDRELARLLVTSGMCAAWRNQRLEAIALLREALVRAEAVQDARALVAAALNLSDSLVSTDPAAAAAVARKAVEDGRRLGNVFLLPIAIGNLVQALLLTGDWDEAEAQCTPQGEERLGPELAGSQALLGWLRGQVAGLDDLVAIIDEDERPEDGQWQSMFALTRAAAAAARTDHKRAHEQAKRALSYVKTVGCSHEAIRWSWSIAAEASLAMGDLDETARLLGWIDEFPVGHLAHVQTAERFRLRAKLAAATSDPDARGAFDEAITELRTCGSPYHLALGLLDQAEWLQGTDPEQAAPIAAEAGVIGERLRCQPIVDRVTALVPPTTRVAVEPVVLT